MKKTIMIWVPKADLFYFSEIGTL